ncbi:Hypothetical_protein [Hexamita inflata]|uniref:Hypothetical_protein n=1 Tax=Hexamita inflata TaxID=28002 RepID=A0AA86PTW9_9EUKA|nr:Hypothetical protein HINF_LOCUS32381 [Hexamita inflata]
MYCRLLSFLVYIWLKTRSNQYYLINQISKHFSYRPQIQFSYKPFYQQKSKGSVTEHFWGLQVNRWSAFEVYITSNVFIRFFSTEEEQKKIDLVARLFIACDISADHIMVHLFRTSSFTFNYQHWANLIVTSCISLLQKVNLAKEILDEIFARVPQGKRQTSCVDHNLSQTSN